MTSPGTSGGRDDSSGGGNESAGSLASGLGRYAGHGLTLALSTALFAWAGSWADDRLGTEPALVLLGVFLGFGAGFYSMMTKLRADGEDGGEPPG